MQNSQTLALTFIGLVIGIVLLSVLKGVNVIGWPILSGGLVYLIFATLGSIVGSVLVANKKPMELLQVKE